jgi:hypothetical protein
MEQLLRARSAALDAHSEPRAMPAQPWPTLALESAWWSRLRDREPVRTALAFVLHEVWERRMQQAFADNERLGRGVRNVTQLAELIVRDASGLNRRVNSEDGDVTLMDLFLFAWALRVPVRDLLPTQVDWIAGAVRRLLPEIAVEDARTYAVYRWHAAVGKADTLDARTLSRVAKEMQMESEAPARAAVLRVAERLESVLTPFAHWLGQP